MSNVRTMAEILKDREKIEDLKPLDYAPNYFNWRNYFDFTKFYTYITITPRSVGKTFSMFDVAFETFEATGEYTVVLRTTYEEIKEVLDDYKKNPPHYKIDHMNGNYEWDGKSIICSKTGKLAIKFVALSTVGNLASITGKGCAFVFYDEFLPRNNRKLPRAYMKLTDFLKTLERNFVTIVVLQANATTLNSEILLKWDIWNDVDEIRNLDKKMWYTYFRSWDNPPKLVGTSNANLWASNMEGMNEFMENAAFIREDDDNIIPESRLGNLRYTYQYRIYGKTFTLALTDDDKFVIVSGARVANGVVYAMTTEDGLNTGNYVRPIDLKQTFMQITYALEKDNLYFTDFETRDNVYKYISSLYGSLQRNRE